MEIDNEQWFREMRARELMERGFKLRRAAFVDTLCRSWRDANAPNAPTVSFEKEGVHHISYAMRRVDFNARLQRGELKKEERIYVANCQVKCNVFE